MKTLSMSIRITMAVAILCVCHSASAQDIVFDFNTDGDYHGFVDFKNRIDNDTVAGGQLTGVTNSGDSQLRKFSTDGAAVGASNNFSFAIADYSDIEIIAAVDYGNDGLSDTAGGPGDFSLILYSGNPVGDPADVNPTEPVMTSSQVLTLSGDTGFNTYTVPLSSFTFPSPGFDLGIVEGIRFDAVNGPGSNPSSISLDSIRLISAPDGLPGDFDMDNDVDADDVDLLSANLGLAVGDAANPAMDLNGDDTVDLTDHDLHITTQVQDANGTGALIGDLNRDGDVDVSQIVVGGGGVQNFGDASVLLASLGQTSGQLYGDGDLNGDGDVDVSQIVVGPGGIQNLGDASRLLANLGQTTASGAPAASAVPEPGSLAVLAITGIGFLYRRRKMAI